MKNNKGRKIKIYKNEKYIYFFCSDNKNIYVKTN